MFKFALKPSQPITPVAVFPATKLAVCVQSIYPQTVLAQNRLFFGNTISPKFFLLLCVICPQQDKKPNSKKVQKKITGNKQAVHRKGSQMTNEVYKELPTAYEELEMCKLK